MKPKIHPRYEKTKVTCACGNLFETRSTMAEIRVGICSECHPFYTGKMKYVDQAGRLERFKAMYKDSGENYGADLDKQKGQRKKFTKIEKVPKGAARDMKGNLLESERPRPEKSAESADGAKAPEAGGATPA